MIIDAILLVKDILQITEKSILEPSTIYTLSDNLIE